MGDTNAPPCLSAEKPCVVLEKFLPHENCTFGLICSDLEGNICGDYGLTVSTAAAAEAVDVCHAGELYSGPVDNIHGVELKLWYHNGTRFRAACHFWCTGDGSLPKKESRNVDVAQLLSGQFSVSPIEMDANTTATRQTRPHNISPMTVYFTNQTVQGGYSTPGGSQPQR